MKKSRIVNLIRIGFKAYGKQEFNKIGENIICCSGTTIGTHNGMKKYLNLMIKILEKKNTEKD